MSIGKVFLGAGSHAVGNFIAQLLGMVVLSIIARSQGVVHYGKILTDYNLLTFITVFVAYGHSQWAISKLAREPDTAAVVNKTIIRQRLILAVVLSIAYGVWQVMTKPLLSIAYFIIVVLTLVAFSIDRRYAFVASLTAWKTAFLNPLSQGVALLGCVILNSLGIFGEMSALSMLAAGIAIPPVLSYVLHNSFMNQTRKRIGYSIAKSELLGIHKIGIANIFLAVSTTLTPVLVSALFSDKFTGLFNAAFRVIGLILMGFSLFHGFLMPLLSKLHSDIGILHKFIIKILIYQQFVSLVIIFGLYFFGQTILNLLFGREFIGAMNILLPLGIGLALISPIGILFANVLLASDCYKQYLIAVILCPAVGLGTMTLLAIPMGVRAAVWGPLIGELTFVVVCGYKIFSLKGQRAKSYISELRSYDT
jgi:O-antigen/teichoic acid export membrane protein